MTERLIFPVWRNRQFIHCSNASVNEKGVNQMREQSIMALCNYDIFFSGKFIHFKLHWKIYPINILILISYYFPLWSIQVNCCLSKLHHTHFEPSQTPLGQSEHNLITIRFELLRFDCKSNGPSGNSAYMSHRMAKSKQNDIHVHHAQWPVHLSSLIRLHCPNVEIFTLSNPSSEQPDLSNGKYPCWPDSPQGTKSFC